MEIDYQKVMDAARKLDTSDATMRDLRWKVEAELKSHPEFKVDRYEVRVALDIGVYAVGPDPYTGEECLIYRRSIMPLTEENYVVCGEAP